MGHAGVVPLGTSAALSNGTPHSFMPGTINWPILAKFVYPTPEEFSQRQSV